MEQRNREEKASSTNRRLAGLRVAITGKLASMSRAEAVERIGAAGATYDAGVDATTDVLVVGLEGWPLRKDGRLTKPLQQAHARQADGESIEIVPERDFLGRMGYPEGDAELERLYTIEQLSRILSVPQAELRTWIRLGLVQPAQTVRRLCFFDFTQVAAAKSLVSLRRDGVSSQRIRSSLAQLERWLPDANPSVARVDLVEDGGRLLVQMEDGRRIEPSGQLHFDFEPGDEGAAAVSSSALPRVAAEPWFQEALRHEEAGDFAEAARAYHRALRAGEGGAELCFNLGNALYAQGRADAAAQRFMQAIERDAEYVEAWNNLGNVLSELGHWDDAVEAYEQALALEPNYADAHFNFGECLHQIGDWARARTHWQEYLKQDPDSSWARHVRKLLDETEQPEPGPRLT